MKISSLFFSLFVFLFFSVSCLGVGEALTEPSLLQKNTTIIENSLSSPLPTSLDDPVFKSNFSKPVLLNNPENQKKIEEVRKIQETAVTTVTQKQTAVTQAQKELQTAEKNLQTAQISQNLINTISISPLAVPSISLGVSAPLQAQEIAVKEAQKKVAEALVAHDTALTELKIINPDATRDASIIQAQKILEESKQRQELQQKIRENCPEGENNACQKAISSTWTDFSCKEDPCKQNLQNLENAIYEKQREAQLSRFTDEANKTQDLKKLGMFFGKSQNLQDFVTNIFGFFVRILGVLMLFSYIFAGILMLVDYGDGSRIEQGKLIIKTTTIGAFFVLASYMLVSALMHLLYSFGV